MPEWALPAGTVVLVADRPAPLLDAVAAVEDVAALEDVDEAAAVEAVVPLDDTGLEDPEQAAVRRAPAVSAPSVRQTVSFRIHPSNTGVLA
ncbi:MAG TPA: hypothetical protein VHT30_05705 [Acidimicrobiales bacterium]|nr:hypothetical protein [Acidimicrobiales bacterium]